MLKPQKKVLKVTNKRPTLLAILKGQFISKCPFDVIVSTNLPTKKFDKFCPRMGSRAVVSRGAEGALTPPEFGSSLNPIPARRGQIMPPTLLVAPPDSET